MVAVLNSWQYYMKTHFGYGCISSTVTVTCVTELTYQHRAVLRKPRRFGYSKDEFANVASPATDPPSPFGSSVSLECSCRWNAITGTNTIRTEDLRRD
jgi:hypothetical protein